MEQDKRKSHFGDISYINMVRTDKPSRMQYKILSMPERMSKKRKAILKKQSKTT